MLAFLLQGLPPLPNGGAGWVLDINVFLLWIQNAIAVMWWAIVSACAFTIIMPIALLAFAVMTPIALLLCSKIPFWREAVNLKNNSVAMAIVLFGFILSITLILMTTLIK